MDIENKDRPSINFDDKPIGQKTQPNMLDQYPPGFDENNIDIEQPKKPQPLSKRINSKVWKIRKQALQQLLNQVKEDPSKFQQFSKITNQLLNDSNQICLDKSLKVIFQYMKQTGKSPMQVKAMVKIILQKCLVIEKQQIKANSEEIIYWAIDKKYDSDIFALINQELTNKNPKICASAGNLLTSILNNYGAKKLNSLEMFTKNLEIYGLSGRAPCKIVCENLFKQLYKWIGDGVFEFPMHHQVKDNVKKFTQTYQRQPMKIKRGLTQQQLKGNQPLIEMIQQQQQETSVDVLGQFDARWVDKLLELQKWKEKKQQLDLFIKKTKAKDIVNRQNSHYITLVKRLLSDNNINLLQCGLKIIRNLCKGLKKHFSQPAKAILSYLFSKLKDKKAMIVDQAQQALTAMTNCISMDDIMEQIKQGLDDKAPNFKVQTLKFLEVFLKKKDQKVVNNMKSLIGKLQKLNQDGSVEVRQASLNLLCKMKGHYGMQFFGDKLRNLPQNKLLAIQKYKLQGEPKSQKMQIQEEQIHKTNFQKENQGDDYLKNKTQRPIKVANFNINQVLSSATQINTEIIFKADQNKASKPCVPLYPYINDISSPNEGVRFNAFTSMLQKLPIDGVAVLKQKCLHKQSSPNILKLILAIVRNYISDNTLEVNQAEVLMYHDWKKCKHLITDFIHNMNLSVQAHQLLSSHGYMSKKEAHPQPFSLKATMSSFQLLLPKMSHPLQNNKIQAADRSLAMLQQIPKNISENEYLPFAQTINQTVNVIKCRLQQKYPQIVAKYLIVIKQLIIKGVVNKAKIKNILPLIIRRLHEQQFQKQILQFLNSLLAWNANFLFSFLILQIAKENLCEILIDFIFDHNQQFITSADLKNFILPLLTAISKGYCKDKCSSLLDQIIQLSGQNILEKIAKESKLPYLQQYLSKWNLHVNAPSVTIVQNSNVPIPPPLTKVNNKSQRIKAQIENPWPIITSASHIMKFINTMSSLGQPLKSLAAPVNISKQHSSILEELPDQILIENSDILIKWVFWKVQVQKPHKVAAFLLFAKRIISTVTLQECQIIILLGALMNCLQQTGPICLTLIQQICKRLNETGYKQKAFRFWMNTFTESSVAPQQILYILTQCYPDVIQKELVTLARFPAVSQSADFMKYLKENYDNQLLKIYGFSIGATKKDSSKFLCANLKRFHIQPSERQYYLNLFIRASSQQGVNVICEHAKNVNSEEVMEYHLKIIQILSLPFLNQKLNFTCVYHYFRYLLKIVPQVNTSRYLLDLTRAIMFMLIDVDQVKPHNSKDFMVTINKCLLLLLERSTPIHILQVLFILFRQQIKQNESSKLNILIPKCMNKVIKSARFRQQLLQSIRYIVSQFNQLISLYQIPLDCPFMKSFKSTLSEMRLHYPTNIKNYLESTLNDPQNNFHYHTKRILTQFNESKYENLENQHTNKSQAKLLKTIIPQTYCIKKIQQENHH